MIHLTKAGGMIAMVWAQLRRRLGRTLALGLAVLVASMGFTVLTASSEASKLQTVGNVNAHARTTYDILVRPPGSRSALEAKDSLIAPGLMTNSKPGISVDQWHQIEKISDIDVAAPLAVVGFVTATWNYTTVDTGLTNHRKDAVVKMVPTWTNAYGTARTGAPQYSYFSKEALGATGTGPDINSPCGPADNFAHQAAPGTTVETLETAIDCWMQRQQITNPDTKAPCACVGILFPLPMLMVAVDPVAENKLDGLAGTTGTGALTRLSSPARPAADSQSPTVPVLMTNSTTMKASVTMRTSLVDQRANSMVLAQQSLTPLASLPAKALTTKTFTAQQVYSQLRRDMSASSGGAYPPVYEYWSASAPTYGAEAGGAVSLRPDTTALTSMFPAGSAPPGSDDVRFRQLTSHRARTDDGRAYADNEPVLKSVGDFDASKLTNLRDDTAKILSGWDTTKTVGADAASRKALGNKPVPDSTNMADFISPSPALVMSMSNIASMTQGPWQSQQDMSNPISAVRVRVKGVTGIDAASRVKVNLAAQKIQEATGLDVDVTLGASTTTKTIAEPAGKFGRPALLLSQPWVKKGVGVAILKAVDKKSLVLFTLVLIVSALSVANSAIASVRGRRTELGVLAALGWGRGPIFRTVATELAAIALIAGLVAALASLVVGEALGTPVGLARAALAVPVALVVTLAAGIVPAWMAARSDPMAAVQPAVSAPRRPTPLRSMTRMGIANVGRNRARTLLAALGLLIGVAAFTTLLAITLGFQGAVVGTVLGDSVAIQARTADYMAVGATLLLAGLGVANVLYLNIRDRGAELATLRAVGWERGKLNRMVVVEGLTIAALGAIPGAAVGVLAARLLTGGLQAAVIWAALVAMLIAFALAGLAAIFSARLVHRLPTTTLLTE